MCVQESAYLTEVHHINAEGEDAGVVYCEMQAIENTEESRTHRTLLSNIYPGHCGYKVGKNPTGVRSRNVGMSGHWTIFQFGTPLAPGENIENVSVMFHFSLKLEELWKTCEHLVATKR